VFQPRATPQDVAVENVSTILIIGGALGSRGQLTYIAENLCERHRVITVDLPGQGGRYKEALSRPAAVAAIKEIVENLLSGKKAIIIGISMGGYIAMQFAGENPDLVSALILHGCHNESSGVMASVLYGTMGMVYKVLSREKLANLVPGTFPKVPKDRMEKSFLRTMLDYEQWPACAEVMKEPRAGFNVEMLSRCQGPVLFIRGDGDFAASEDKFLAACKNGRNVVIAGGSHLVPYEEPGSKEWHESILKFIDEVDSLKKSTTETSIKVELSSLNFQN
jgi:pimeloyl-ACP methyl ester carboxylesterase